MAHQVTDMAHQGVCQLVIPGTVLLALMDRMVVDIRSIIVILCCLFFTRIALDLLTKVGKW